MKINNKQVCEMQT